VITHQGLLLGPSGMFVLCTMLVPIQLLPIQFVLGDIVLSSLALALTLSFG